MPYPEARTAGGENRVSPYGGITTSLDALHYKVGRFFRTSQMRAAAAICRFLGRIAHIDLYILPQANVVGHPDDAVCVNRFISRYHCASLFAR
jgi:hypothetical protein